MKKIAVCFSGAIRNIHSSLPSIIKYFINPMKQNNVQVDIFLYLTYINKIDQDIKVKFKMVPSNYNQDRLLSILKPKKYIIIEYNSELQKKEMLLNGENFMNHEWKDDRHQNYAFSAFGMYAKIYKCNQLRKQYEKENNFKYDFVWRARLDYIFLEEINLKMIHLLNNDISYLNDIYLIKDRYATNTKQETNDKFIGCNGDIMDLVCYTYYLLPEFLKKFNEKGILLEGQAVIQHRIKQLKQIKKINKCHMLGHYNTYYKCQGRHKIKFKKKNIYIELTTPLLEICYLLLYEGYGVYTKKRCLELEVFDNYHILKKSKIFDFIITDTIEDDENIMPRYKIKKFVLLQNELLQRNLLQNNTVLIYYAKDLDISRILIGLLNNVKHQIYHITTTDFNPSILEVVYYYRPDRGKYRGEIIRIKNYNNQESKYLVKVQDNSYWCIRRDIRIIDWNKHIGTTLSQ